jgi:hypothetical protein
MQLPGSAIAQASRDDQQRDEKAPEAKKKAAAKK